MHTQESRSVREQLTHRGRRLPPTQLPTHPPTTQPLHLPTHYYHLPTNPPTSQPLHLPTCTHPGLVGGEAAGQVPQQLLRVHLCLCEAVQVARDKVVVVEQILRQAGRHMRGEGEGLPASHSRRTPAYQVMTNIDISPVCTTTQRLLPGSTHHPLHGHAQAPQLRHAAEAARAPPTQLAGLTHPNLPTTTDRRRHAGRQHGHKMRLPVGGEWP